MLLVDDPMSVSDGIQSAATSASRKALLGELDDPFPTGRIGRLHDLKLDTFVPHSRLTIMASNGCFCRGPVRVH
jgi:hypothetical protein